jgi:hypothetical protein
MADDLDILDPAGCSVTVGGQSLTVRPLTIGQLPPSFEGVRKRYGKCTHGPMRTRTAEQKAKQAAAARARYAAKGVAAARAARARRSPRTAEQRAARLARAKACYAANRERISDKSRTRYAANPESRAKIVARANARYAANPEALRAYQRAYNSVNAEKIKAYKRDWQLINVERIAARMRAYSFRNAEKLKEYYREWCASNRGSINAQGAKRRTAKLQATPPWVNLEAIKAVYIEAAARGLHVDHIIPLQGRTVCGLHVPWNLQLLTQSENSRKKNRWTPI